MTSGAVSGEARARCRIGIDVGGTFTDFVLTNPRTGGIVRYKEPSVPGDPSLSVGRGLPVLIERAGVRPGDVELLVHGTTLLVNAIIERRGARVGLVVSRGHRGVLEIGRMSLDNSFDFTLRKEEPLVPRNLVFEAGARVLADGSVAERPSPADLDRLASDLAASRVESVTVLLLNSYAFPEMEREVAEALRRRLPGVPVTGSAAVWPEQREFERGLVAIMNAYVQPLMSAYLHRLEDRVAGAGVDAPIYITASNGGTLGIDTARERPIDTVLSGPASGLVAATRVARSLGRTGIITVDLGGTSCDLALNQGEEPEYATSTRVGDYPLVVPVVNVRAIGAGGGSVLWADPQGVLKVGPESAGADPGPACYGRGGARPTLTDCYLLVGLIHPGHFLGGRMRLDRDAARGAMDAVADRMGYEGGDRAVRAADAALRVASAMMANELAKGLARRGASPREFALMAFGGAGPTHANLLAEEAGLDTVVVPPGPATFCALGAILADVKRDYVRSHRLRFADGPPAAAALASIFRALEEGASSWIRTEGDLLGEVVFDASLDMRYAGQAFDLQVPIPEGLRKAPDLEAITELFHREHERIYGFRDPGSGVEVSTERVRVTGRIPPLGLPPVPERGPAEPFDTRRVYVAGRRLDVPVLARRALGRDAAIPGPAIIEQEDCTVWVLPGWNAAVHRTGSLLIRRSKGAAGEPEPRGEVGRRRPGPGASRDSIRDRRPAGAPPARRARRAVLAGRDGVDEPCDR